MKVMIIGLIGLVCLAMVIKNAQFAKHILFQCNIEGLFMQGESVAKSTTKGTTKSI